MFLDLIVILFIIVLSFVLCMNDKGYGCQMSHILLGLSVIIIYKVMSYLHLDSKKESFVNENLNQAINQFISGTDTETIDPKQVKNLTQDQYVEYVNKVTELNKRLSDLQTLVANPPASVSPGDMTSLDLSAQQQYQMFQIDYLSKQIRNAQQILNSKAIADSTSNYKPIKVLSSCNIASDQSVPITEEPVSGSGVRSSSGATSSGNVFTGLLEKVIAANTPTTRN